MDLNLRKGVGWAVLAAGISGVSIFLNKYAVAAIGAPLVFTATKNMMVGLLIFGLLFLSGKWRGVERLTRGDWLRLGIIGLVGGSIPFYLFFTGLSLIPAVNAAIIQKTLVLWVAMMAIPILKEKLSLGQLIAVVGLFAANLLVGGFSEIGLSFGELMVFGATFLWAVETVIVKKVLVGVNPDLIMAARMGFGAMVLVAVTVISQPSYGKILMNFNAVQWGWLFGTAVLLFFYVRTWLMALKWAPAITVTSILVGSTLITNLLSAVMVTHVWTLAMVIQAFIIVLGSGFLVWQTNLRRHLGREELA